MTRLNGHQVVQRLDYGDGDVVLVDESSGDEVVVAYQDLLHLEQAVHYFRTGEAQARDES